MRITYLAHIRFPSERAHGAQIAHMCNAFTENGDDVTLIIPKHKSSLAEDTFKYYDISERFDISTIYCTPWYVETALKYNSRLLIFSVRSSIRAWKIKSEIVYSREAFVLWIASFIFPIKKLVWESHEAKYNLVAKCLLKKGIKCVAISKGIKDFYIGQGIPAEQILIADDGIDKSFFEPLESKESARVRLGLSSYKPIVMYIGGLDEWKGVDVLLEASQNLSRVLFVVIGGTDDAIAEYGKRYPEVKFLGSRPYRELANNQQAADILVCTNSSKNDLSSKYTSPLKLFSYIASKVPVLVADVPSITSIVSENEVFLYNTESNESIVGAIRTILENPDDASSRTNAAYELSKKFTWTKRAANIISFYNEDTAK